jgi:hypothetical protein
MKNPPLYLERGVRYVYLFLPLLPLRFEKEVRDDSG